MASDMPHRPTIARAMLVQSSRSFSEPGGDHTEDFLFGCHAAEGPDDAATEVVGAVAVAVVVGG